MEGGISEAISTLQVSVYAGTQIFTDVEQEKTMERRKGDGGCLTAFSLPVRPSRKHRKMKKNGHIFPLTSHHPFSHMLSTFKFGVTASMSVDCVSESAPRNMQAYDAGGSEPLVPSSWIRAWAWPQLHCLCLLTFPLT